MSMKKILYFLLLLPFASIAQTNGVKIGAPLIRNAVTDGYPVGYQNLINGGLHSYATLAGRDSLNTYYSGLLRDGMQVYVRANGLTYRWNNSGAVWDVVTFGNTYTVTANGTSGPASLTGTVINIPQYFPQNTPNATLLSTINYNTWFKADKTDTDNPLYGMGATGIGVSGFGSFEGVNNGWQIIGADGPNSITGQSFDLYGRLKNPSGGFYPWYKFWHSGNMPMGTPGQSVRVNSAGTAFEAYTPVSPYTVTANGTSGPATLTGNVINVPQYFPQNSSGNTAISSINYNTWFKSAANDPNNPISGTGVSGFSSFEGINNGWVVFGADGPNLVTGQTFDLYGALRNSSGGFYNSVRFWHTGNMPVGATGQSVRFKSDGTLEPYTPAATSLQFLTPGYGISGSAYNGGTAQTCNNRNKSDHHWK
jgi:hypothetical protein